MNENIYTMLTVCRTARDVINQLAEHDEDNRIIDADLKDCFYGINDICLKLGNMIYHIEPEGEPKE